MKNWKQFFRWSQDLETRKEALADFAASVGAGVKNDTYVWANGRYLILHFDLINISPSGSVDRADVYDDINCIVGQNGGTRLTESVYLVPLLMDETSERCAAMFWNALRIATAGKLRQGDSFYVHFAPDTKNLLGGLAEVVPSGSNMLLVANVPVK